jgi:hypothetical protein
VKSIFALSLNRFTQVDVIGSTKVQLISEGEIIIDSENFATTAHEHSLSAQKRRRSLEGTGK